MSKDIPEVRMFKGTLVYICIEDFKYEDNGRGRKKDCEPFIKLLNKAKRRSDP